MTAHSSPLLSLLAAVSLVLACNGCAGSGEEPIRILHDARRPIGLGTFPFLERTALVAALEPLSGYLSANLGRTVRVRVSASYADLDRALAQHRVDIGWFTPPGHSGSSAMETLCRPVGPGGLPHHGLIVARKSDGPMTLASLAGRRFAYVDRISKSGYLYPNRLFSAHAIDPLRYFASVAFAGNHDRVIEQVLSGAADAGAVSDMLLRDPRFANLFETRLAVVSRTEPIPEDPIVASPELEPELKKNVKDLLLGMADTPAGKKTLEQLSRTLGIERFE
ncbi:MAG: phosphate/phosphite/phosphonate ABC transporter substrate-binding protein [Candidatus Wallbacteria bacterium]|nr:phosphate/phosphite/phosphonate ABC transporter substrate-binding protein [Candidatus Wallbacteria bacterium]